jgi:uncharacterized protein YjbI with pentapeptide repeats
LLTAGFGVLAGVRLRLASAQEMMAHVDLSSPRMSQAEMTREQVEALVKAGGPVSLTDKSLNGLDLSGLDLSGADLRWARLNKAVLKGAKLAGARLELAWALDADLTGADLGGANLFQAQLLRSRLDDADLSRARITATFDNASLRHARLREADGAADMRNQSMGLMHASFRSARLDGADMTGARLSRADFEFAHLAGAHLDGADMSRALLGGADLTGASVAGLDLVGADLVEVSPPFDPSGQTAWVGVNIMFELLCALADRAARTSEASSLDELARLLRERPGFIRAHWCDSPECEARVKAETGATIRCIPLDEPPEEGACVVDGRPSRQRVLFARAY